MSPPARPPPPRAVMVAPRAEGGGARGTWEGAGRGKEPKIILKREIREKQQQTPPEARERLGLGAELGWSRPWERT